MFLEQLRIHGGAVEESLAFFELSGPDAAIYLDNQTPSKIPEKINDGLPNVFVSNKGAFICSFFVFKEEKEKFLIVLKTENKNDFLDRLELYHISEDFETLEVEKKYQILVGEKLLSQRYNEEIPYWYFGHRAKIVFNEKGFKKVDGKPLKFFHGFHEKINRKLFTDTRYIDFCYDKKKGCFPGQETVAKIVNNRGAALSACLLQGNDFSSKDLEKGELIDSFENYHLVLLPRECRVNKSKLKLLDGTERVVFTFPYLEETNDSWAEALYYFAHTKFHEGKVDQAKELLGFAINIKEDYADAYEMLGVILGREDKYLEAIELMKKLVEVDSNSIMGHTNLSLYYMKVGEIEKAEDEKSKAMLKEFEKAGQSIDEEEATKKKKEEESRKESMFKEVLEIDEEDFIALFGLGEIAFKRNEFEKSLSYFDKALSLNPKHSQTYLLKGKTFLNLNQVNDAKIILEKGIKVAASQGDMMPANEMQSLLNNL